MTLPLLTITGPIVGAVVVAVITYLTSRPRMQAEVRKLEAESERTKAETTKILSEFQARPSNSAGSNALPTGWYVTGARPEDYDFGVDAQVFHSGHASAFIQAHPGARECASLAQVFKADAYRGRRMRLSAMLKTKDVAHWAGLWLRVDDALHNVLEFDNTMDSRSISGTQSWSRCHVVLDVPGAGATIRLGFILTAQHRGVARTSGEPALRGWHCLTPRRQAQDGRVERYVLAEAAVDGSKAIIDPGCLTAVQAMSERASSVRKSM